MTEEQLNKLSYEIIGAAYMVRNHLSRFLYESSYEQALQIELKMRGIHSDRQVEIPAFYRGVELEHGCRIDLLVEKELPIELKVLEFMGPAEVSQIMTYLQMGGFKLGFLINFGAADFSPEKIPANMYLKKGIYRMINSRL